MDPARAQRILRQHLRTDALMGLDTVPVNVDALESLATSASPVTADPATATRHADEERNTANAMSSQRPAPSRPATPARLTPAPPPIELDPDDTKPDALQKLREALAQDQRVLAKLMPGTQLVFGEGNPDAEIMFIGEGAGADEARTGRPFVGRAGQLLDNMIKAMGLSRDEVYITNCVHFQPPGNRTPQPDEIDLGWPYMIGQVQVVKPKVIVAVGGTSAKALLNTNTGITRLRGRWHDFDAVQTADVKSIPLMPTFHPAFLLRSYTRENRAKVWADLVEVLKRLGKEPPNRSG